MAFQSRIVAAHLISVHAIPDGISVDLPSIYPGRYWIPSVEEDPKKVKRLCSFNLTDPVSRVATRWQYAEIVKHKLGKYVLVSIPDCITIRTGIETMKFDEFGQRLSPDISRMRMPVLAEDVANEIEKQKFEFGVSTIEGTEPNEEQLKTLQGRFHKWSVKFFNDTTQSVAVAGQLEATPLAVYVANMLFQRNAIPELPLWAALQSNVDPTQNVNMQTCPNCLSVQSKQTANCLKCSAILNWKLAVERGLVTPGDVPPSKLAEAGLAANA